MSPDEGTRRILVVANETVVGRELIDAVKGHAEEGDVRVTVVCPVNAPKHGNVIYEESVSEAASNRLEMTLRELREAGIEAEGELGDADPYSATMDALEAHGADQILVSTYPETRSGWLRRDLIDRIRDDAGVPVEHVVVDMDPDDGGTTRVLVVANQTVGGRPLIEALEQKAAESPHSFVVICPQSDGSDDARRRLEATLERLRDADLDAVGQTADPDPLTAVQNALQYYTVDEIVISTFPETRSGWLRRDLIGRVRSASSKPVEHIVVDEDDEDESASDESKETVG